MFQKRPRVVNNTAIEAVKARDVYCLLCGREPMHAPHHIVTRGRLGPDAPENLVRLCRTHHGQAHDGGVTERELQGLLSRKYGYRYPWQEAGDAAAP
jgi:hypothetical protein